MIDDPDTTFAVVMNDEEQYSIWPLSLPLPRGWRPVGVTGQKVECRAHIENVWTDMRPKSVREQGVQEARGQP